MSDEAKRWKTKYLESLEQQEQLESLWQARLDLLRRSLVRSSLAAEGSDKVVDQCMEALRDALRRDDIDVGLAALLPRLEKAVLDSEKRRQGRIEQNVSSVTGLANQLLALEPPREVRKALKQFAKRIDERAKQAREMPALLSELSRLQQQALSSIKPEARARLGLLQRLFGASEEQSSRVEPPASVATQTPAPTQQPMLFDKQPAISRDTLSQAVTADEIPQGAHTLVVVDPAYALPDFPEPAYSTVAPHIGESLLGLLDELSLPERHQPQAELLRQRVQAGLNWYELVVVLDDLAVLVLAVADSSQYELADYLQQLNQRLEPFMEGLAQAQEGASEASDSARQFNRELREHVTDLQSSVQEAGDLASLKQALETRLDDLLGSVVSHQALQDARDQQLAQRLQRLSSKVAEMEQQTQTFREHLEEQRQKALLDPLTGLANRAAWNERIELEIQRSNNTAEPLWLAVLDIDHFKRINDTYGHLAGDKVLKIIASALNRSIRRTDFIARIGGEEFVLLMPATTCDSAEALLVSLLKTIEQCPFHFRGERIVITLSAGLSCYSVGETTERLFERADQALYRAKRAGRNRLERG